MPVVPVLLIGAEVLPTEIIVTVALVPSRERRRAVRSVIGCRKGSK
jgi:hypothetical protein